jgi:WD40 repeat protein
MAKIIFPLILFSLVHSIAIAQNQLFNAQIIRGLNTNRNLLSTNLDGSAVDLWSKDESGRQKWIFEPHTGANGSYYNILVQSDVQGPRKYLSTNNDGSRVDLWTTDDGSGRQQWKLENINTNPYTYRIKIAGGVTGPRVYLSCSADGGTVDLWIKDDDSGRQQWVLNPPAVVAPPPAPTPVVPAGLPLNVESNFAPTHGGVITTMTFRYSDQVSASGITLFPGDKVYVFPQQLVGLDRKGITFDPANPSIGGKNFTIRQATPELKFTEKFPEMRNTNNHMFLLVVEVYR